MEYCNAFFLVTNSERVLRPDTCILAHPLLNRLLIVQGLPDFYHYFYKKAFD